MLGEGDITLFRKIHPRQGLHVRCWGPDVAARVDRLVQAGLVTWQTASAYPGRSKVGNVGISQYVKRHGGIKLALTQRGQSIHRKY